MKSLLAGIVALMIALYAGVVVWGLHDRQVRLKARPGVTGIRFLTGPEGELVRQGQAIFNHTPLYAREYTGGALSCESCHAAGGLQPFAAPMVGVKQRFPQYSQRAGRVITLEDRIRECFVRSENGLPPADGSEPMKALLAYMSWLSPEEAHAGKNAGVGIPKMAELIPDPEHGAEMFAAQCAGCHGAEGQGKGMWPPLWGARSFNDGAGMNRLTTFAAFIQHNMPYDRKGRLTPQESYDIAAYVLKQRRPAMNPAYARY